eukprot:1496152-Rhodomonas_salina.1
MWPGSSEEIAGFVPEGVVTITERGGSKRKSKILILEVARSHTVEESDMEEEAALKRNCYQTTRRE